MDDVINDDPNVELTSEDIVESTSEDIIDSDVEADDVSAVFSSYHN